MQNCQNKCWTPRNVSAVWLAVIPAFFASSSWAQLELLNGNAQISAMATGSGTLIYDTPPDTAGNCGTFDTPRDTELSFDLSANQFIEAFGTGSATFTTSVETDPDTGIMTGVITASFMGEVVDPNFEGNDSYAGGASAMRLPIIFTGAAPTLVLSVNGETMTDNPEAQPVCMFFLVANGERQTLFDASQNAGPATYNDQPCPPGDNDCTGFELAFVCGYDGARGNDGPQALCALGPPFTGMFESAQPLPGASTSGNLQIEFTVVPGEEEECPEVEWVNAADGSFHDDTNWEDELSPGEAEVAVFDTAGEFIVTFDESALNDALIVESGAPAFALNGSTYELTGDCRDGVTISGSQSAELIVSGGTLEADSISIANDDDSTGELMLSGGANVADEGITLIGDGGIGTLFIGDGIFSGTDLTVGVRPASEGEIDIVGPDAALSVGETGTISIGFEGIGDLNVLSEGNLSVVGDLIAGEQSIGNGTVTIADADTDVDVGGLTIIGKAGNGSLMLSADAFLTSAGITTLGGEEDSIGTATVESGGFWLIQEALNIGFGGEGDLTIDGLGSTVTCVSATMGNSATGSGALSITDQGSFAAANELNVGAAGPGVVSVETNGTLAAQLVNVTQTGQLGATFIYIGAGLPAAKGSRTGVVTETLVIEDGATLEVADVIFEPGARLGGTGSLPFDVTNTGTVMPGGEEPAAGRLTINGDYTQEAAANLEIELGGSTPAENFDVLAVTGTASLTGTLNVDFLNGFTPGDADRFDILTAGQRTGDFTTITGPAGFTIAADYSATGVTISAARTAAPPMCGSQKHSAGLALALLFPLTVFGSVPRRHPARVSG